MSARFGGPRRGSYAGHQVSDHLARLRRRQTIAARLLVLALAVALVVGLVLVGVPLDLVTS